jgi:hypothetical protein
MKARIVGPRAEWNTRPIEDSFGPRGWPAAPEIGPPATTGDGPKSRSEHLFTSVVSSARRSGQTETQGTSERSCG